jgi:hypothetical protein
MQTKVIHIRNAKPGFKKQNGDQQNEVYIGRPGTFGNPVAINKRCPVCGNIHRTAGTTLPCYEEWLLARIAAEPDFKAAVLGLKGKTLVCFCKPGPCHGDVLAKYTNAVSEE